MNTLRLALVSLVRSRRRSLLTAAGLANAVVGGLMFYGFTRHTYWGLSESFARGGNGHVQVADAAWFDSPAPEQHRVERGVLEAARAALARDPTIASHLLASAVRRDVMGMLVADGRSGVFLGVGTEPAAEALIAPLAHPVAGTGLDAARADGAVLGGPLAARLGVHPGDTVTALVTTDGGLTNGQDLGVLGLAATGSEELDRTFLTLPLDTALALADGTTVDVLVLALTDTADTDAVLAATRRVLAAPAFAGLDARPWYERASYYKAVRALYDRIFGVFEALMALVTVLSLSHAVASVVAERRAEIAMLRVVGLRRRDVAALFVAEGALLGVLGCVAGAGIAQLVAWGVARLGGIPMPPPPGFTVGYAAQILLDSVGYAIVLPVTFFAAVGASALPAWRATRGELSRGLMGLLVLLVALPAHAAAPSDPGAAAPNPGAARPGAAAPNAGAVAVAPNPGAAAPNPGAARPGAAAPNEGAGAVAPNPGAAAGDPLAGAFGAPLPHDQRCVLDLTLHDGATTLGWRVAIHGDDTLAVSTTLAPGHRQAMLQAGGATWFQTEGMGKPMKVGLAQRVFGPLSIADVVDPRLTTGWVVTPAVAGAAAAAADGAVAGAAPAATVHATARPGAGLAYARAEFDLDAAGRLHAARFQGPSGTVVRTAGYRYRDGTLVGVDVAEAAHPGHPLTLDVGAPVCAATPWSVAPDSLLSTALALAEHP
jgi:putative ABC transport system permease protein